MSILRMIARAYERFWQSREDYFTRHGYTIPEIREQGWWDLAGHVVCVGGFSVCFWNQVWFGALVAAWFAALMLLYARTDFYIAAGRRDASLRQEGS